MTELPSLPSIQEYARRQRASLAERTTSLVTAKPYRVGLDLRLADLSNAMSNR